MWQVPLKFLSLPHISSVFPHALLPQEPNALFNQLKKLDKDIVFALFFMFILTIFFIFSLEPQKNKVNNMPSWAHWLHSCSPGYGY